MAIQDVHKKRFGKLALGKKQVTGKLHSKDRQVQPSENTSQTARFNIGATLDGLGSMNASRTVWYWESYPV